MGLSISTPHQSGESIDINQLVSASIDLNKFNEEYKYIYNNKIINIKSVKQYQFHKYMIINDDENYVNIDRYLESYTGDSV